MKQLVIAKVSTLKRKISNVNLMIMITIILRNFILIFGKFLSILKCYGKIFEEKKEKYEYHFRMSYGLLRW